MQSKTAQDFYHCAKKAEKRRDFAQALACYKSALQKEKDYRPVLVSLGVLYARMGEKQSAVQYLERAYTLRKDPQVCFNLGAQHFKLQNYDSSAIYLKECLSLDGEMLRAYLLLAYLYHKQEEQHKAKEYFEKAFLLAPDSRMAVLGYAEALSKEKRQDARKKALSIIEAYLKKVKTDHFAQELRGALLLSLGKSKAAHQHYSKLSQSHPKFKSFSDHIAGSKKIYAKLFQEIDEKITSRASRLSKKLRESKAQKQDGAFDPVFQKEDLQDTLELSLLHLFKGESQKAMDYLFHAQYRHKKAKDKEEKSGELPEG